MAKQPVANPTPLPTNYTGKTGRSLQQMLADIKRGLSLKGMQGQSPINVAPRSRPSGGRAAAPTMPAATPAPTLPNIPGIEELKAKGLVTEGMDPTQLQAIVALQGILGANPINIDALMAELKANYEQYTGDVTSDAVGWLEQILGANMPTDPAFAQLFAQDPIFTDAAGGLEQMQETAGQNLATDQAWFLKQQQAMQDYYNALMAGVASGAIPLGGETGGGGGGGGGGRGYRRRGGGGGGGGSGDSDFTDPRTTVTTQDQIKSVATSNMSENAPGFYDNIMAAFEGDPDAQAWLEQLRVKSGPDPEGVLEGLWDAQTAAEALIDKGALVNESNAAWQAAEPSYVQSQLQQFQQAGLIPGDNPETEDVIETFYEDPNFDYTDQQTTELFTPNEEGISKLQQLRELANVVLAYPGDPTQTAELVNQYAGLVSDRNEVQEAARNRLLSNRNSVVLGGADKTGINVRSANPVALEPGIGTTGGTPRDASGRVISVEAPIGSPNHYYNSDAERAAILGSGPATGTAAISGYPLGTPGADDPNILMPSPDGTWVPASEMVNTPTPPNIYSGHVDQRDAALASQPNDFQMTDPDFGGGEFPPSTGGAADGFLQSILEYAQGYNERNRVARGDNYKMPPGWDFENGQWIEPGGRVAGTAPTEDSVVNWNPTDLMRAAILGGAPKATIPETGMPLDKDDPVGDRSFRVQQAIAEAYPEGSWGNPSDPMTAREFYADRPLTLGTFGAHLQAMGSEPEDFTDPSQVAGDFTKRVIETGAPISQAAWNYLKLRSKDQLSEYLAERTPIGGNVEDVPVPEGAHWQDPIPEQDILDAQTELERIKTVYPIVSDASTWTGPAPYQDKIIDTSGQTSTVQGQVRSYDPYVADQTTGLGNPDEMLAEGEFDIISDEALGFGRGSNQGELAQKLMQLPTRVPPKTLDNNVVPIREIAQKKLFSKPTKQPVRFGQEGKKRSTTGTTKRKRKKILGG